MCLRLYLITFLPLTGALSQYNSQSLVRREVFQMPTEVSTRTNVSHTMLNDPYFSGTNVASVSILLLLFSIYERHLHIDNNWSFITDGMMMTTSQHTETSGMMTQITKEVVQRSVMGGTTVTKKMFYES